MTDEEIKALLDAAANKYGKAYIPGVGIRYMYYNETTYEFGPPFVARDIAGLYYHPWDKWLELEEG